MSMIEIGFPSGNVPFRRETKSDSGYEHFIDHLNSDEHTIK